MSTFDDLQYALGGTYRLDRELGGGGMSRVFLADDLALSRQVVLKVLPVELAAVVNVERFNRETLLLARLQHPHIVPVLTVGSLHGLPWFSMPYIEGESLRARIDRDRALPIGDVVSVMRDVAKALAYAHERGVIHRDIKPDNILLTGDAATVADFGIAKAINVARADVPGEALTQMGMAIGTPGYMSPEQVTGSDSVDHRTDIYALGCVAYEMLCGSAPFGDKPVQQQLTAHLTVNAVPIAERRANVPPALAALVMQCLEKDAAMRPQEARDIVAALELAGVRSGERTGETAADKGFWHSLTPRRVVALSVVGLLLVVVGYVGLGKLGIGPAGSLQARGTLAPNERLVITDFTVRGADSLLGRVASDAVRAGLVQSGAITLLTPNEIGEALGRMERPRESRLSLELVRDLANREGVRAIVDGELTAVGASYILAVRLVTADSGRELASFRATAASPDSLIQMADDLSRKLRSRIGESLQSVKASPPLERVTTSSLEALRKYSAAVQAADVEGNKVRAAQLFREAVAIDTLFAEGWRRLGLLLSNMTAPPGAADSALSKAYLLRDRLREIDAERVTATYFAAGSRADRSKAIPAFERVLALGDSSVLGNLAAQYESRREFARAEVLRRLVVARDSGILRLSALRGNLWLQGKWSALDSIEATVRRRFPNDELNDSWARTRAFMAGDLELQRRLLDSAVVRGDSRDPVQTANQQMVQALNEGRLRDADRFREASLATYRAQGVPINAFTGAFISLESAIDAGVVPPYVLRRFEDAVRASSPTEQLAVRISAARAYAKFGMVAEAKAALAQFDRLFTDSTQLARYIDGRNDILMELAIAEGRWVDAAAMVRRADQKPDGPASSCVSCFHLKLLKVFAAVGLADSALAQYDAYRRTAIGSRPRIGPDLYVPITSTLALARIYDARGDRKNAAQLYRDYVTRFERADAEFQPIVREARARMLALMPRE
jgi:Protein kinase domain